MAVGRNDSIRRAKQPIERHGVGSRELVWLRVW